LKERGAIDIDAAASRRPRKPSRRASTASPVIGLRLSEALLERLAAYAEEHGITRSVAIRRLISQGLDRG
jgi:hypothetical protein